MAAAQPETSPSGRKLTGSILEHSGLDIERMPGLPFILELFCTGVAGALRPLFGEGASATIEETRTTSVFDALAKCAGQPAALVRCEELDARMAIILAADATEFAVESIFGDGDSGASPTTPRQDRPRTNIETCLLGEFAQSLARALEAGFAGTPAAALTFESLRTLSDVTVLGRRDTPAIAARLRIASNARACVCTVLLPQALLQSLRLELSVEPSSGAGPGDPRWIRQLRDGVSKARVPVTAVMVEIEMTLGDVARLRVGTVLTLRGDGMGQARLECAGRAMFQGRLGQGEGRYCLEIEDRIDDDEAAIPFAASA